MNFSNYKNRLIEFLQHSGIQAQRGLIHCFSPNHDDKNPSCEIFDDHFICYSGKCGIHGDIYDAVEIIEGITDKKEQYLFLEKIFDGTITPRPAIPAPETKETFTPDPTAVGRLEKYFESHTMRETMVKEFLTTRAITASSKLITDYPQEILSNLVNFFYYWPGLKTARGETVVDDLRSAGIPQEKRDTGVSSWDHSGIVIKLAVGYKLHFYNNGTCEKRGSKGCQTFPAPGIIADTSSVVLVEGEMDAIVCTAAGIAHVFSTGGTNGLTEPKIKKYLLYPELKTITILFDADLAGQKASGLVAYAENDKNKKSLPDKLRSAGYTGSIKIAQLQKYKDPDQAILYGHTDLVISAIESATEWQPIPPADTLKKPAERNQKKAIRRGTLSVKDIIGILKKMPITELDPADRSGFISSIINSVPEIAELAVKDLLRNAGADEAQLKKKHLKEAYYLVTLAKKYNLSYYFVSKIEKATITKEDLEKFIGNGDTPLVDIDFNLLDNDKDLKTFIYKRGEKSAAAILSKQLAGRFIYVENEKKYYFFNGLVWQRQSDISGIAYNMLTAIVQYYIKKTDAEDQTRLKALSSALTKIEEYKYCTTVMKALSEKPVIFRDQITFDGPQIQETLTLQDGVIDFSGKSLRYRNSKPDEYRRKILPYSIDQVREAGTPENFMKFMRGNFRNADTLETLMYYLSLLPSRRAQFKVGGIFVGVAHTGKTTTMKIISEIYPEMTTPIPRELIMSQGRYAGSSGPNPYIARLEGAGAGISDETKRNDILNGALWKQLTGGGMLTARGMYAMPRDFLPTAQIIILTNYSPKFDGKDQATIDRMVVVPFAVQHKKGDDGTIEEDDLIKQLRPEFPRIVRLFAEYYIRLKTQYKSKIPLSHECESYKADYVENQETDLDRFVSDNIEFIKDDNCWVKLKDVYTRFAKYNSIDLDENGKPTDRDNWSQSKFTRYLRGDYNEIRIKQRKINGYPEQIILNMRLKDWENRPNTTQSPLPEPTPIQEIPYSDAPDDDPFA